tara:strand:- start:3016 stop:3117 length:102 start_codon:yes stop_codon:yes gene_type:complete
MSFKLVLRAIDDHGVFGGGRCESPKELNSFYKI